MYLLTPNRSLTETMNTVLFSPMEVSNDPRRITRENTKFFTVWFEVWLVSYVLKSMD